MQILFEFGMVDDKAQSYELETYNTKDIFDQHTNGSLTIIWRDWNDKLGLEPKMLYTTSIFPGEIKGPHLHKLRDSFFLCIKGKVLFIIKENDSNYVEIESSDTHPVLVKVPKGVPSAHINLTNETSTILSLTNISWKPNDNEMVNLSFDNYDWSKWKNHIKQKIFSRIYSENYSKS